MGDGSGPSRRTVLEVTGASALAGLVSGCAGIELLEDADEAGPGGVRAAVDRGSIVVTIDGERVDGWRSLTLPGRSVTGASAHAAVTHGDLTMERAAGGTDRLWRWQTAALEGDVDEGRTELSIRLMDDADRPLVGWRFAGSWVTEYDPPVLGAGAEGDVATESATVAFDRMEREEV